MIGPPQINWMHIVIFKYILNYILLFSSQIESLSLISKGTSLPTQKQIREIYSVVVNDRVREQKLTHIFTINEIRLIYNLSKKILVSRAIFVYNIVFSSILAITYMCIRVAQYPKVVKFVSSRSEFENWLRTNDFKPFSF